MSKTIIVKYERGGDSFEILAYNDIAYDYVTGKVSDPLSAVEVEEIYKDAKKGERQSSEKIRKAFGTEDIKTIVGIILKNGNVPISTEQKNKLIEEKRKQIIDIIATNSVDPKTGLPNPPLRIENAMSEVKINIDPFKSASEQVNAVLEKISPLLPIKFSIAKIEVIVPAAFANKCYGILKRYNIKNEQWLGDGSLKVIVEFPAGMQNEFFDRINKATEGAAETKIISR
ncbi:MAG: ribosome assembly factor SBDS [Candidatus Micrarchaeaceae archaeon]